MKRLRLLRILWLTIGLLCAAAADAAVLFDQSAMLFSTNYQRGVNWQSKGGLPRTGSGDAPSPNQFRGGIVYGAVSYQGSRPATLLAGASFPGNAEALNYPRFKSGSQVTMVLRTQVGAPYMMRSIAFFFGQVISPPPAKVDGTVLAENELTTYWAPEPASLNNHANAGYYWSPHARKVYATQPGRVDLTWRVAAPEAQNASVSQTNIGGLYFRLFSTNYIVSGASVKPPQKMFWTEKTFQSIGKPVRVPAARVGVVNIVYQNEFPERVAEEVAVTGQSEIVTVATNRLQELRTLWFDRNDGQIHAYNKEGRVFVELLGDVRTGTERNQLGYEIVDVSRQAKPVDVAIELGEKLHPGDPSTELFPEPLLSDVSRNFAFQQGQPGSDRVTLYATRETKNLNDYQVFWMQESIAGLRWPSVLARYAMVWPTDPARYSHYLRPASDQQTARQTAVPLPPDNLAVIEWQDRDGVDNPRAFLTEDFKFYSYLDADYRAHRTLLRFAAGDNIAFERVFSILDNVVKTPGFDGTRERAINPSSFAGPGVNGALDLDQSQGNAYGQVPAGVYFDGGAFTIESWVYVRSHLSYARLIDVGDGSLHQHLTLALSSTTTGKPILVVTSSSVTATEALPLNQWVHLAAGYNPNEEHALMLGGQAYALRDDLNVTSGANYSSHPYVLVEYIDSDGRPGMSAFQVLREKGNIKFDYSVKAGTILQPPMPLPFLEKPLGPKVIGEPARSLNASIPFWPITASSKSDHSGVSHVQVTTQSRHFFTAYESLVLQDVPTSGTLTTRWLYPTNVDPTAKTVSGFVTESAPYVLSAWPNAAQPATAVRYRYKVESAAGLAANNKVVIAKSSAATNWIATVTTTGSDANGTFVEVEFAVDSRTAAAEADRLIKASTSVADNQFGTASWRLAYQPVSSGITDANLRQFYAGFTLQDRKRDVWVYRGPHNPADPADNPKLVMQFYYKTLPGFFYPGLAQQPTVGTITPYLRPTNADGTFAGDAVNGDADNNGDGDDNSLGIIYRPVWPEGAPVLQMAETLTLPKRSLPAVRGQRSLEIVYQQSQLLPGKGLADRSAVLHDPTREKVFAFGPKESSATLGQIPASVKTSSFRGKTYFPNLSPHLSERFFFDPSRGSNGALVFHGQFFDEAAGEDYLLLNVIGQKDLNDLKGLCAADDERKGLWDSAITTGLQTVLELFVENRAKPGTFIPSSQETIGPSALAEVKDDDVAVDSYALTAVGPGTGYVSLIAGNGLNTDVQPAEEPVAGQIIRVVDMLYPGELKIVKSSNPLAEKLTLQQVVDLAGKLEDYEFEWKITSPVDGQPPAVYQNTRQLLLGDGAWHHIRFPLPTDTPGGVSESATPSNRRAAEVNGTVMALSRIPFVSVSPHDGKLQFQLQSSSVAPVAANKLVVRYEDGTQLNATVVTAPAGQSATTLAVEIDPGQNAPSGQSRIIDLYERAVANQPQSVVFREFSVSNATPYSQFYLSLNLDAALGAKVYVNGSLAVTANLAEGNSATTTAPIGFSALPRVYRLGTEAFAGGVNAGGNTTHRIAVELFSSALPNVVQTFNLRLEAYQFVDPELHTFGRPSRG